MSDHPVHTLPNTNIQTLAPKDALDFFDSQSISLSQPTTPLAAWQMGMSRKQPILDIAFKIRDAISSLFGVKKIGGFSTNRATDVRVGGKLDFFVVEHHSKDVLTLSERDKHLDVLTCISTQGNTLTITSSVQTHNLFGRLYMIPVRPAHRLIVRIMLKRIAKSSVIAQASNG